MKKQLFILTVLINVSTYSSAQITFQKTFGGTNNDVGYSVHQTNDGGYIIAASTSSFGAGNSDVYVIRTNANGDSLWTRTFGGFDYDYGLSAQQTTDSGFIIAGSAVSFGSGSSDVYLIKTDANGDSLWTKTIGGTLYDGGQSVQQTTDSGYIITGSTSNFTAGASDVFLTKTDVNGNTLWTKTFGGMNDEDARSVQQTSDGGYIIAGSTYSFGAGTINVYLIRTDANGDTVWTKTFGGTLYDEGWSVHQTTDGGFVITGYTYSFSSGNDDVYVIRTDSNGDALWTKTFGGTDYDEGKSIKQTADGGYIITGNTISSGSGLGDVYLIKTDANGDTLWTKTIGGTAYDEGNSIEQTADGGYIIAGGTLSFGAGSGDVYLIKTDANGNSGCNQGSTVTIVTTPATQVTSPATIVNSSSTIITSPATIVSSGGTVTTVCTTVGIESEILNPQSEISISPNPSPGNFSITFPNAINNGEVQIFNAYGAKVFTENVYNNITIAIHLKNIPGGIYFVKAWNGEKYFTNKIIIQKD